MTQRILFVLCAVVVLGLVGFAALAWKPAIRPVEPPAASSFSADQVAHGEQLVSAGFCATCHTRPGGAPLAGGYPMATPFGTIYSTNITPDPKTGIGDWSEAAFERAMREGVARDGSHLFPAFPFDHYTKLSDADIAAIYAYLMTRAPVDYEPPPNTVPYPLNIRALQAGWKALFFRPGEFVPEADRSAEWNRGAYLAEALGHCGACHTPRNALGAEEHRHAYAGATIDDWIAPALTRANPSPLPWTQAELVAYLGTGVSHYHGTAGGPMAPVVQGLAKLPPADIDAIAVYFAERSPDGMATGTEAERRMTGDGPKTIITTALDRDQLGVGLDYDATARLYTAACASCHYNGDGPINPLRPPLPLISALTLDEPTNLIQVILHGIDAADGAPGIVMPAFTHFTDDQVAAIAGWLRATRTDRPAWTDLPRKVAAIRHDSASGH